MGIKNILMIVILAGSFAIFSAQALDSEIELPTVTEAMGPKDWLAFAHIGGGYVPIPAPLLAHIPKVKEFLASFYRNADFKGPDYFIEPKLQQEYLLVMEENFARLPKEVKAFALGMKATGRFIVEQVLRSLAVNENIFHKATGGLTSDQGKCALKVAHYNPNKEGLGIQWHKDIRWVSVLFAYDEGLQAKIGDRELDAGPKDGYFFVNLGVFFEAFINDKSRGNALVHQVRHVNKDRSSMIALCEGNYEAPGFYQLKGSELYFEDDYKKINEYLVKDPKNLVSTAPQLIFSSVKQ